MKKLFSFLCFILLGANINVSAASYANYTEKFNLTREEVNLDESMGNNRLQLWVQQDNFEMYLTLYVPENYSYIPTGTYEYNSSNPTAPFSIQKDGDDGSSVWEFYYDWYGWLFDTGYAYVVNPNHETIPKYVYFRCKEGYYWSYFAHVYIGDVPTKRTVNITTADGHGNTVEATAAIGDFGNNTYYEGDEFTLIPHTVGGYSFSGWSGANNNEIQANLDGSYTFTVGAQNYNIAAIFVQNGNQQRTISTAVSPSNSYGSVSGGGSYFDDEDISLTAQPSDALSYYFVKWQDNNSKTNPRAITVSQSTAAITYTAVFEDRDVVNITASDDLILTRGSGYWSVAGAGTGGNNSYTMNIRFDASSLTGSFNSGVNTSNTWVQKAGSDKVYAQSISVATVINNSGLYHVVATIIGSDEKKYVITGDYAMLLPSASWKAYSYDNPQHEIEWDMHGDDDYNSPYNTWYSENDMFVRLRAGDYTGEGAQNYQYLYLQLCFWVNDFSVTYNGTIGPKEGVYTVRQATFKGTRFWDLDPQYLNNTVVGGTQGNNTFAWNSSLSEMWSYTNHSPYCAFAAERKCDWCTPNYFSLIPDEATVTVSRGKNDKAYVVVKDKAGTVLFTVGEPNTPRKVTIANPGSGKTITVKDALNNTYETGTMHRIPEGTVLTISVSTTDHTHISGWTGTGNAGVLEVGTSGTSFTLTVGAQNYDLSASFAANQYYLNATAGTHGTGVTRNDNGNSNTPLAYNSTVTLTPVANEGYEFDEWAGADKDQVVNNVFSIPSNALHNTTYYVQATFQAITYNLTYNDLNGATNTNPATYTIESEAITLVAPGTRDGYTFTGWYDNVDLTGDPVTSIAQGSTGNRDFYAKWTEDITYYQLAISAGSNGTVNDEVNGSKAEGTEVEIEATANTFYEFVQWSDGNTENPRTVTMNADVTLFATFAIANPMPLNDNEGAEYYTAYDALSGNTGVNVQLMRTLKADTWSTICLPFDFELEDSEYEGKFYQFMGASGDYASGLNLYFSPTGSVEANVPYLFRSSSKYDNPDFRNATLHKRSAKSAGEITYGNVSFQGTVAPKMLNDAGGHTILGLIDNKVYYPNLTSGTLIRAFRAYFVVGGLPAGVQPRVRIVVSDNNATAIDVIETDGADGMSAPEVRKYMENGILIIERNGVKYNAEGAVVR